MERVYLQKIVQHNSECYIGKMDPRKLVRIAKEIGMGEVQSAQRPLSEKRVKDIAHYVDSENGILPNTLTHATSDNRIIVKNDDIKGAYIDLPSFEEEYAQYKNALDVMDGQHRLYSFLPNIRQLHDDINYEIGFTLYIQPTQNERREIFVTCNEKQEKVNGNLLMWFKEQLNMLSPNEKNFYNLVSTLNNNNPLKGRIIMGAERIRNGYKAKQVMAILQKGKIQEMAMNGNLLTDEQKVKIICLYLFAWERVVGFSFANSSQREAGAAVKISGLRYMLWVLPALWERVLTLRRQFNAEFVEDTLKKLISSLNVEREKFFTCPENQSYFTAETPTWKFAMRSSSIIRSLGAGDFDPLRGI